MYLLMLLATFMSAIYGYNISARPDYDRDVAKKKAAAVIYRFTFQHDVLRRLAIQIAHGEYATSKGLGWVLPGDSFYTIYDDGAVSNSEDLHTIYNQDGHEALFFLRNKDHKNNNTNGDDLLTIGRYMFDGSEMGSKIICLDIPMNETASKQCEPTRDGEGNVTNTCCGLTTGGRYLVSYRKMDARWINRISGDVSLDFTRALMNKDYFDNIGVIMWKNGSWQFRGKINFLPVYADDMDKWDKEHGDADESYPSDKKKRAEWTLPNWIFKKDFFQSKGSLGTGNICDDGCLFKIQAF